MTAALQTRLLAASSSRTALVTKRRPAYGVRIIRLAADGPADSPLSWESYESPLHLDGIIETDLRDLPEDHQAAVALHWFTINFKPMDLEAAGSIISVGVLNEMISGRGSEEISTDEEDWKDTRLTAGVELNREFDLLLAASTLTELSEGLRAQSPFWELIPQPDPLPIEREPGLQSVVDAAIVARDAQALEDHFKVAPGVPAEHGQNYWPGAELLDELRTLKKEVRDLRALAATQPTSTEPIEKSVRQLAEARKKVGAWFTESYVKALGTAAGNATVVVLCSGLGSALGWWHTLFHLLTTALQSTSTWLASLVGG